MPEPLIRETDSPPRSPKSSTFARLGDEALRLFHDASLPVLTLEMNLTSKDFFVPSCSAIAAMM
jgi:hypothetical protein